MFYVAPEKQRRRRRRQQSVEGRAERERLIIQECIINKNQTMQQTTNNRPTDRPPKTAVATGGKNKNQHKGKNTTQTFNASAFLVENLKTVRVKKSHSPQNLSRYTNPILTPHRTVETQAQRKTRLQTHKHTNTHTSAAATRASSKFTTAAVSGDAKNHPTASI